MKAALAILVLAAVNIVNGIPKNSVETETRRFLVSQNSWVSWMQKVACLTTCVSGFEPLTKACCTTGDNLLCQNLPFALLNNSIGHCPAFIPCTRNPCQFGICIDTSNGFHCTCQAGYSGKLCDTVDACVSSPCSNGVCSTLTNGSFTCTCNSGFTGRLCDKAISVCSSNPCVHGSCSINGSGFTCACLQGYFGNVCDKRDQCSSSPCAHGKCFSTPKGEFICQCSPGYEGTLCDRVISACSSNPCAHGVCSVNGSGFTCACNQGYFGDVCNKRDPCSPSPCGNGKCFSSSNGEFICSCLSGFVGTLCDKRDPCMASPCGHGKCMSSSNGLFNCTCLSGFTGLLCDTQIVTCSTNPCIHGHCTNRAGGYTCKCDQGYFGTNCDQEITDCKFIQDNGILSGTGDSIYVIHVHGSVLPAFCDMFTDGGGWTVLMNRINRKQNFEDQDFRAYATGFGDVRENFWAGLETMHALTSDGRRYQLRVELQVANGTKYYETYDDFSIGAAKTFALHVGIHNGNAGDSLSGHDGFGFTTKDADNDINTGTNCALYLHGAWWFHNCYDSCLTCPYLTPGTNKCRSFSWNSLGYCIALKSARMMVRPM